jgi:hypothetical protein
MFKYLINSLLLIVIFTGLSISSNAQDARYFRNTNDVVYNKNSFIQKVKLQVDKPESVALWSKTESKWSEIQINNRITVQNIIESIREQGNNLDMLNGGNSYYDFLASGPNTKKSLIVKLKGSKSIDNINFNLDYSSARISSINVINTANNSVLYSGSSSSIKFPSVTVDSLQVDIVYDTNVRVNSISINSNEVTKVSNIVFLAKPNQDYVLYSNPNHNFTTLVTNLNSDASEVIGSLATAVANPILANPDKDQDGIIDSQDNCVYTSNTDQKDIDKNNIGDVCQDNDGDGVIDSLDNCPFDKNSNQLDIDRDGLGDICDKDDNRFLSNERWVLWVALGLAVLVVIVLTYKTVGKSRDDLTSR